MDTREVEVNILHECGYICSHCSGSGEGMHDGSTCWVCKGRGYLGPGEIEQEYTVEVYENNIQTGPTRCEDCDLDLTEILQEEIKRQHGTS